MKLREYKLTSAHSHTSTRKPIRKGQQTTHLDFNCFPEEDFPVSYELNHRQLHELSRAMIEYTWVLPFPYHLHREGCLQECMSEILGGVTAKRVSQW